MKKLFRIHVKVSVGLKTFLLIGSFCYGIESMTALYRVGSIDMSMPTVWSINVYLYGRTGCANS